MRKLNMKTRQGSVRIYIGTNSIKRIPKIIGDTYSKVVLICDKNLKEYVKKLEILLTKNHQQYEIFYVNAGEELKSFKSIENIFGFLIEKKIDRKALLIAIGGGTVGDCVGFVAATYLRGVDWMGIPTTLLSLVDSSIGGKTAINHKLGKNMIGAFHQPKIVICDPQFLLTLPNRELYSGLGEVLKYAVSLDQKFFSFLQTNLVSKKLHDLKFFEKIITLSLSHKIKLVQKDELDLKGIREILNFGHTLGHSLETLTKYKVYQHGEAVLWGIKFALYLSLKRGHLKLDKFHLIQKVLDRIPLPLLPSERKIPQLFALMKNDKKTIKGKTRFVLLKNIGKTILDKNVTEDDLFWAIENLYALNKRMNKK